GRVPTGHGGVIHWGPPQVGTHNSGVGPGHRYGTKPGALCRRLEYAGNSKPRWRNHMLPAHVAPRYDFIICGSGSAGSVVAARTAENPGVSVLLIEAGGADDAPEVIDPGLWPNNLGSERDWAFTAEPSAHVNGRSIELDMGKVLGGGSSINVMAWARGHKTDWDFFATEAADDAWSYQSVLDIYRRIEDWDGTCDAYYRGVGGPVYVRPAADPNPIASAILEGARAAGIPSYGSLNGAMME